MLKRSEWNLKTLADVSDRSARRRYSIFSRIAKIQRFVAILSSYDHESARLQTVLDRIAVLPKWLRNIKGQMKTSRDCVRSSRLNLR